MANLRVVFLILSLMSCVLLLKGMVEASNNEYYIPVTTFVEHQPIEAVIAADGAPFKQCSSCNCCAKDNPNNCKNTQCCHELKCDPSGKCSLVPISCDCNNCS
ncbi:hypothetical protein Cni_G18667 [Canna indica]|uniref:DUF7866 domain-containing protein n=1 Tax=Canna indica TaxID=4628 RepID=A0AAQ3QG98_9LILI|nr:hypothetical protein Cni_G18667 [Canna indica]